MTENIIILAGGASSRMKKSTDQNLSPDKVAQANQLSKGLIELGGKPFLSFFWKIFCTKNSKMFTSLPEKIPKCFVGLLKTIPTLWIST